MKLHKKNSKLTFVYFYFSFCFFWISLSALGGCAGPQTTASKNQIKSENISIPVATPQTQPDANSDIQKDPPNLSTALGLPLEASQNSNLSLSESFSSNTTETNDLKPKKDETETKEGNSLKVKVADNAAKQTDSLAAIIEETFESNKSELPSNIKSSRQTTQSTNIENSSEAPWGIPDKTESSNEIEVAQKPSFYPTERLNDIYFEFDAFKLDQTSKNVLKSNADWLSQNPAVDLEIHGHCDERGTNNYNLGLGEKRALTVKKFLIANGISSSRIYTISFGEEKPFCFDKAEKCWRQNRRAHFQISKKSL